MPRIRREERTGLLFPGKLVLHRNRQLRWRMALPLLLGIHKIHDQPPRLHRLGGEKPFLGTRVLLQLLATLLARRQQPGV